MVKRLSSLHIPQRERIVKLGVIFHVQSVQNLHSIPIVTASARGIINTMKVELPEIDQMTVPVVRLERTPTAIVYQTFDANSVLGRPIMDALSPTSVF